MSVRNKLTSAYVKCMKLFFGIRKYGSVSAMLIQVNLPSFHTVLHNARVAFHSRSKLAAVAGRPVLSIDIFCAYGAQQQTRRTPLLRSTDETD